MTRRIFIDTDTASDDAVALMMAFKHVAADLVGISIVAGNVPTDQGVQNALYMSESCSGLRRLSLPVQSSPLSRPLESAQHIHGNDGMGDIGLDVAGRKADAGSGMCRPSWTPQTSTRANSSWSRSGR